MSAALTDYGRRLFAMLAAWWPCLLALAPVVASLTELLIRFGRAHAG